ncbi:hypothetical protein STAL104432_30715 [Streptomyces albus]
MSEHSGAERAAGDGCQERQDGTAQQSRERHRHHDGGPVGGLGGTRGRGFPGGKMLGSGRAARVRGTGAVRLLDVRAGRHGAVGHR